MSSTLLRLACLALLLAAPSLPGSARADETPGALILRPEHVELLPLDPYRYQLLASNHGGLLYRMRKLGEQISAAERKLVTEIGKPKQQAAARAQLAKLEQQLLPLSEQLRQALQELELDEAALFPLREAPRGGPRRVQRYARSLALRVSGLTPAQEQVVASLVSAVDGVQMGLVSQRNQIQRRLKNLKGAAAQSSRATQRRIDQRINQVERRFWWALDFALSDDQRAEIRQSLPRVMQVPRDAQAHLARLPGLSPAQAARIKALRAGAESELVADVAEQRRLEGRLRAKGDKALKGKARQEVAKQLQAVRRRIAEVGLDMARAGREILTPEQWAAYRGIPPTIRVQDRNRPLASLIQRSGLRIDLPQSEAFGKLLAEGNELARRIQAEARELRVRAADFGPDSPQIELINAQRLELQGRLQAERRELGRVLFLEILRPEQVQSWVLGG